MKKATFAYLLQRDRCVYIDIIEFEIESQYILNISQIKVEYIEDYRLTTIKIILYI